MPSVAGDKNFNFSQSKGISDKDFNLISSFIYKECGIKIGLAKKTMIESRLLKRLRALNMPSFSDYCAYLFSDNGLVKEIPLMIDLITTNKTDFFREPKHFEYLVKKALPDLLKKNGNGFNKKFNFWSAGCSTGEEPYTLAIILTEFALTNPNFKFFILATDISQTVLSTAQRAVYPQERVFNIEDRLLKRYFLKSKDKTKSLVKLVPEIREKVAFRRLNLMEYFSFRQAFDVIFCRNVIIYFDRQTQERLMVKFNDNLDENGYLFVGHSETLHGMNIPLVQVYPTIYKRAYEPVQ